MDGLASDAYQAPGMFREPIHAAAIMIADRPASPPV